MSKPDSRVYGLDLPKLAPDSVDDEWEKLKQSQRYEISELERKRQESIPDTMLADLEADVQSTSNLERKRQESIPDTMLADLEADVQATQPFARGRAASTPEIMLADLEADLLADMRSDLQDGAELLDSADLIEDEEDALPAPSPVAPATPATPAVQAATLPPPSSSTFGLSRGRVLVIEEDFDTAEEMRRVLSVDYEVTLASSPDVACARLAEKDAFEVVLCSLAMGDGGDGMSGIDVYLSAITSDMSLDSAFVFTTKGTLSGTAEEFLKNVDHPLVGVPLRGSILSAVVSERVVVRRAAR